MNIAETLGHRIAWDNFFQPFCEDADFYFWKFVSDIYFTNELTEKPQPVHEEIFSLFSTDRFEGDVLWKGEGAFYTGYGNPTGLVLTGPCTGYIVTRSVNQAPYLGRVLSANGGSFDAVKAHDRVRRLHESNALFDDEFVGTVTLMEQDSQLPLFPKIMLTLLTNTGYKVDEEQFRENVYGNPLFY